MPSERIPDGGGSAGAAASRPAVPAHRLGGRARRRLIGILLVSIALAGGALAAGMMTGFLPAQVVAGDPNASGHGDAKGVGPQTVKVIRPRRDPNFRIATRQFAMVEPYYQAGLRTRVTGVVRTVSKDIGESVKAGELLIVIDVPDLVQAVEQKSAVILQREKELTASRADLVVARSALEVAAVAVKTKDVDVNRAKDIRDARKVELDAITVLFDRNSVERNKVEAATLDFQAACRAVEAAQVEVERAKVEQLGKSASLEKAQADVELKRALVEVARSDREAAAIQAGYSRLYAPFDGTIIARTTDPGKYVFAGTGTSDPLITIARTDIVTVVTKIPDSSATFVSRETQASIIFTQIPGVTVHGPITRFSRAIDPTDQTMRVEVDVYNGLQSDYQRLLVRAAVQSTISPLIPFDVAAGTAAAGAGLIRSMADHKGWHEGNALIPDWGPEGQYRPIVPGTTATVRLELEKFTNAHLLPSRAIYGRAGQQYILVVEEGITRQIPVAVQMNDGTLAKAAVVTSAIDGRQVIRELTGNEVIVAARQLEVGDGTQVNVVVEKW